MDGLVVNWFSEMVTFKRQGRQGVSEPSQPVDVNGHAESPTGLPDHGADLGGMEGDGTATIETTSGHTPSRDAPDPTVADADEAAQPVNLIKQRRLAWVVSVLIVAVLGG